MRTREILRARLKALLPSGEAIPPMTAIETLLCDVIDDLRQDHQQLVRQFRDEA